MSERVVWDGVVSVIRETLDDTTVEITRATSAKDIPGWDSLANVEVVVALEMAFDVQLSTGQIASLKNVGELADAIEARIHRAER